MLLSPIDTGGKTNYAWTMRQSTSPKRSSHWAALLAHPAAWVGLAGAFLAVDLMVGPIIQFPIAFIFPVALAAWHRGLRWAALFAVGQPLARFFFNFYWDAPWSMGEASINLLIRVAVLCGFAGLVTHTVRQKHHIAVLERLLPVCAWCKRIRDEQNTWQPLDIYLSERAELSVSHGICPDCRRKEFPELPPV